jgi:serine/threonine-protein kinase
MGVVLRVRDSVLGRSLALKALLEEHKDRPELVRRFLDEARLMGQLQHPGVPPVHDLGELPDGRPFFALKLIKGRTLAELLKERKSPTEELPHYLGIFGQVCQTIAYAHSKGVLHRDLKPGNVMVGAFGEVQVMDWGLAKLLTAAPDQPAAPAREATESSTIFTVPTAAPGPSTQVGSVLGTPAYMAPEQARGEIERLDERADVFGLGAILCVILTGQPPFLGSGKEDTHRRAMRGELDDAFARLDACGADAELVALAKTCLAPRQEDRPRDATAVAKAVAAYQQGVQERLRQAELERARAETKAEEAKQTARAERRARRLTLGLAAAAVLLVAGGGIGAWLLQRQHAAALARKAAADEKAKVFLAEARGLVEQWRKANRTADLEAALAKAENAVDATRSGAGSDEVREKAEGQRDELAQTLEKAKKNDALLDALSDMPVAPQGGRSRREMAGKAAILAEPELGGRLADAFRRWGLDLERTPPDEAATRLGALPPPVVEAVVGALDAWALVRSSQKHAAAEGERLAQLADRLDTNTERRRLRRLLRDGSLRRERVVDALTRVLLPWSALCEPAPDSGRNQLLKRAAEVKLGEESVLGIVTLARGLGEAGAADRSEALLRSALASRPNSVPLLMALGRQLEGRGRLGEAIECYRAVFALRPSLGIALSRVLIEAKRTGEAETILRDLLRKQPDNAEVCYYLGKALRAQKQLAEAVAAYHKAIDLKPDDAMTYNNLGVALRDQKKLEKAVTAFRKADQLLPNQPLIRNNLRQTERLLELDKQLPDILAGNLKPRSPQEQVELALFCGSYKRHYLVAVHFFMDAFLAEPRLAADLNQQHRYNAACSAALAAAGQGEDAGCLPDKVPLSLRRQTLRWLRADMAAYTKLAERDDPKLKQAIQQRLKHWQKDADLASVRDKKAVEKLPLDEHKPWQQLWADVEALRKWAADAGNKK